MRTKRSKSVPDSSPSTEEHQKCSTCMSDFQLKCNFEKVPPLPLSSVAVIDLQVPASLITDRNKDPNRADICSRGTCECETFKLQGRRKAIRSQSLCTDRTEDFCTMRLEELDLCAQTLSQSVRPDGTEVLSGKSYSDNTDKKILSTSDVKLPEDSLSVPDGTSDDVHVSYNDSPQVEASSSISCDISIAEIASKTAGEFADFEDGSELQPRNFGLNSFMDNDSLDAEWRPDDDSAPITICCICYEYTERRGQRDPEGQNTPEEANSGVYECSVCSGSFCTSCKKSYYSSRIFDGFTDITCPGDQCTRIIRDSEIERDVSENAFRVYQKNRVELENDPLRKTCPGCSKIYTFTENNVPKHVVCGVCNLLWCVPCYAPWHSSMTCQEFQRDINNKGGRKALKSWAKSKGKLAANAKKCPNCKFYIERISGCDHMTCTRCHTDFCYRCGKRHKSLRLLGNHYSTYSFLGCKYNLFPGKPAARIFVRSTVLVSLSCLGVLAFGSAVAAGSLLVAVSPFIGTVVLIRKCRKR